MFTGSFSNIIPTILQIGKLARSRGICRIISFRFDITVTKCHATWELLCLRVHCGFFVTLSLKHFHFGVTFVHHLLFQSGVQRCRLHNAANPALESKSVEVSSNCAKTVTLRGNSQPPSLSVLLSAWEFLSPQVLSARKNRKLYGW